MLVPNYLLVILMNPANGAFELILLSTIVASITLLVPIGLMHPSIHPNFNGIAFVLAIDVAYLYFRLFFIILFAADHISFEWHKKYNWFFQPLLIFLVLVAYCFIPTINHVLVAGLDYIWQITPNDFSFNLKVDAIQMLYVGYYSFALLVCCIALLLLFEFGLLWPFKLCGYS